jgi:hypothetical protein
MKPHRYQLEVRRDGATWRAQLTEVSADRDAPRGTQRFDSPLALLEFLERDLPTPDANTGLD